MPILIAVPRLYLFIIINATTKLIACTYAQQYSVDQICLCKALKTQSYQKCYIYACALIRLSVNQSDHKYFSAMG